MHSFSLTATLLEGIAAHCNIQIEHYTTVQGGDINEAYCLQAKAASYFLKLNDATRFPGMFETEAAGLSALRRNGALRVPNLIGLGVAENRQWLLLEWLQKAVPLTNTMKDFGAALARLHQVQQPFFGWQQHNYIGSLLQLNTKNNNWVAFYTNCRIIPLVRMLVNKKVWAAAEVDAAQSFCEVAGSLFPEEPAALLHGDLWSGNYMATKDGGIFVFDPALYYGHREMEIGMTKLFGGFPDIFYDAYQDVYPLEKDWEQRLPVTQLYPLLVHAVLFGGQYAADARQIIYRYRR